MHSCPQWSGHGELEGLCLRSVTPLPLNDHGSQQAEHMLKIKGMGVKKEKKYMNDETATRRGTTLCIDLFLKWVSLTSGQIQNTGMTYLFLTTAYQKVAI